MAKCPECGGTHIEQYKMPFGPMWCLDCGFRVEEKCEEPNPFLEVTDEEKENRHDRLPLQFHPVTAERLPDLARFSLEHGKFRYCSCMRWRMTSTEFRHSSREERVAELEAQVCQGSPVGILAYAAGEPVAWCSVGPRETFLALERYRALPRVDDAPVWSVTCFFVDRRFRRQGVTVKLLRAAAGYAKSEGAQIVEGYPVEPGSASYTYMGSPETFRRAGFRNVTPEGQSRQVMRIYF